MSEEGGFGGPQRDGEGDTRWVIGIKRGGGDDDRGFEGVGNGILGGW